MKIIFNTDQTYLHGGIEKVMATKANYFAGLPDVEVYIVTTEQQNNLSCYPLDEKINQIDLGINYNRAKSYFSRENLLKAFQHYSKQRALFKKLKPDVIISPNYNFDHYWLPFIHQKSKKIKERHGSRFFEAEQRRSASFFKKIKFLFNDWIDRKYDHIIALNADEKKYVKSGNAVVIPNPVELSGLTASLTEKQVIAAGRISPVKGFDDLIKAWSFISTEFPDWQLHIYGQDYLDTQKQLEQQIKNFNLENSVAFKGSVEDIPKIMTNYSIYAMSSETECFPMVLLEAMSVGLPIVSYDCPNGPRNIITQGQDGLLAEYRNPEDLAANIKLLMENEILRKQMGKNAKENVGRFTESKVMKQWQSLLNLPNV